MRKKRVDWIDYLKGLAIILVVIGHAGITMDINKYILSFHMPLFFIISGMLYNEKKYYSYSKKEFLCKKFNELIIPYLFFSLIGVLLSILINIIFSRPTNIGFSIISILTVLNIKNINMIELVLWFLPCMYVVEIIFYLIAKNNFLFKNIRKILIIFFVIALIESSILEHFIPFTLDIALTGIVYFGIGFIMKEYIFKYVELVKSNNKTFILSSIICIIISVVCVTNNSGILYMYINQYGNYILSFIGAISGSIVLLNLAIKLPRSKWIVFLGQNTLLIFVLHLKIKFITNRIFDRIVQLFNGNYFIKNILALVNTFLIFLILIPIIKVINGKFSWMLGKFKKKEKQKIGLA